MGRSIYGTELLPYSALNSKLYPKVIFFIHSSIEVMEKRSENIGFFATMEKSKVREARNCLQCILATMGKKGIVVCDGIGCIEESENQCF